MSFKLSVGVNKKTQIIDFQKLHPFCIKNLMKNKQKNEKNIL